MDKIKLNEKLMKFCILFEETIKNSPYFRKVLNNFSRKFIFLMRINHFFISLEISTKPIQDQMHL